MNGESSGSLQPPAAAWRGYAAAALIGFAATCTFLTKAFHIDDVLYLAVARQILANPFDPYGAVVRWEEEPESLFDADFNPPGWSYVLAAGIAVAGETEIALHALEGACVVLAAIGLFRLASLYTRSPLAVTAALVLGPAFLPGYNIMLEGPLAALLIWSVVYLLEAQGTDSGRPVLVAACLAGAAVFVKYTAAVVLGAVWLWLLWNRRRGSWFILGPVLVIAVWSGWSFLQYGRVHPLEILLRAQTAEREPVGLSIWESWGRVNGTIRGYGAVTTLAIPALVLLFRRNPSLFLVVLLTGVVMSWVATQDLAIRTQMKGQGLRTGVVWWASPYLHAYAFAFLGTLALAAVLLSYHRPAEQSRETAPSVAKHDLLLVLWNLFMLLFGVFAVPFLAVRHLVIGIIPATLLVAMRIDEQDRELRSSVGRMAFRLACCLAVALGVGLADADRRFANWYREMARTQGKRAVELGRQTGNTAWFFGHWGWVYYAESVGMRLYDPRTCDLKKGDIIIFPVILTWKLEYLERPEVREAIVLAKHITPTTPNPLRTISREVHYYSGGSWNLPWQFSDLPLDDFLVYAVIRDVPRIGGRPTAE